MGRFFFNLIPWWLFAAFALGLVPAAFQAVDDYFVSTSERALADVLGPPTPAKLSAFDPRRDAGPLDEIAVSGLLRADVGLIALPGDGTDHRVVFMGGQGAAPLIAILLDGARAEDTLTQIVDGSDSAGRIILRGFVTSERRGDIQLQLDRVGLDARPLYVVDPYVGDRGAALDGKVQDALIFACVFAGIVAACFALAVWRFRRWRKRRVARRAARQVNVSPPAQNSSTTPPPRGEASRPPRTRAPKSPWGGAIDAPSESVFEGTPPIPDDPPPLDPSVLPKQERAFESVFPGGGSGFRFKTADEIIRQSFGTVTLLSPSKPKE